jgi:hypothetical protein
MIVVDVLVVENVVPVEVVAVTVVSEADEVVSLLVEIENDVVMLDVVMLSELLVHDLVETVSEDVVLIISVVV